VAELFGVFARAIEARGIDVKLSGPESGEVGERTREYLRLFSKDPVLMRNLGAISYHSYWSDDNMAAKSGLGQYLKNNYPDYKIEMSEWCELPNRHAVNDIAGALITARRPSALVSSRTK